MQTAIVIVLLLACVGYVCWYGARALAGRKKPGCGECNACAPGEAETKRAASEHFVAAESLRRRR